MRADVFASEIDDLFSDYGPGARAGERSCGRAQNNQKYYIIPNAGEAIAAQIKKEKVQSRPLLRKTKKKKFSRATVSST